MKKLQALTLVLTISLFSSVLIPNQLFGQESDSYLMMVVYDAADKGYAKIVVTENGRILEDVKMPKFYYKTLASNQVLVNNTLDRYKKQGYKLVSMSGSGAGLNATSPVMTTIYIFEK